jgi:hypothetical protein
MEEEREEEKEGGARPLTRLLARFSVQGLGLGAYCLVFRV